MTANLEMIETEVLGLAMPDRARLAEKIILSLDAPPEEENLRLWIAEAERRLQEMRSGNANEIPVHEAFSRIRAALA